MLQEEELNKVRWKETTKLKARQEYEEAQAKAQEETDEKIKNERLDKAQTKLFIGATTTFSLIGFVIITQHYGIRISMPLVVLIVSSLIALYCWKKETFIKVFKISTGWSFCFFKNLNVVLKFGGMSVTNNKRR